MFPLPPFAKGGRGGILTVNLSPPLAGGDKGEGERPHFFPLGRDSLVLNPYFDLRILNFDIIHKAFL